MDLAIYEFAPGRALVRDKRKHVSIGFTAPLGPIRINRQKKLPFIYSPTTWYAEHGLHCRLSEMWRDKHSWKTRSTRSDAAAMPERRSLRRPSSVTICLRRSGPHSNRTRVDQEEEFASFAWRRNVIGD